MGVKLVVEVLDHAPAGLTSIDRLLLVVIAEQANDATRECWPGWELIARRMQWHGNRDGGKNAVSTALARMAERGVEVRVALAKDGAGRPVYAVRGRRTTYRIPEFRAYPQAERVDESATQAEWVASTATQSGRSSANAADWVAESATQEWVDESATHSAGETPPEAGMGGNPEGNGWQSGGEWVAQTATPSPQEPSKNPQAKSSSEDLPTGGAEPPPPPRYGETPETLPEPLQTIYRSLLDTNPDVTLAEARRVGQLVASLRRPQTTRYYETIAANGGYGEYLDQVRAPQRDEAEQRINDARRTGPWCEHGEAQITVAANQPLCPMCRRNLPVPPQPDQETNPEVVRMLTAYRTAVNHEPTSPELIEVAALATRLVKGAAA